MKDLNAWRSRYTDHSVNGLPLPKLLLDLIKSRRWKHPGDDALRIAIPFLRVQVLFLGSPAKIAFESQGIAADHASFASQFHVYRCSRGVEKPLPWLDVDAALFIAVNKNPGEDIGIALDYRTSLTDPSVVAGDWHHRGGTCKWLPVAPTFTEFVSLLGLKPSET